MTSAACHQVIFLATARKIPFPYSHRLRHRGLRARVPALHGLPLAPEERTFHLLNRPDSGCATDSSLSFA